MATPTIATLFQIGVDNAQIQVPQLYTVPANPPSIPNPPTATSIASNSTTATTADSVTLYLSAIQGFSNELTISFFIQQVNGTTSSWAGKIGSTPSNMVSGTFNSLAGGWTGTLPFTLIPNNGNALYTYSATNYITLFLNPLRTGGAIDPSFPPTYSVTIYATDNIASNATNTYTACNFLITVVPAQATYGLGVYAMTPENQALPYAQSSDMAPIGNLLTNYINLVTLQRSGYSSSPISVAYLYYFFYPLEPESVAPSPVNINLNIFSGFYDGTTWSDTIIDTVHSTITLATGTFTFDDFGIGTINGVGGVDGGFTRDSIELVTPYFITEISGSTTSATSTVMTDTSLSLIPDSYVGDLLTYTSGPAGGSSRLISSNTVTTVTVGTAFSPAPTPSGGDTFTIERAANGSTPIVVTLYLNSSAVQHDVDTPTLTHALLQLIATDNNGVSVSAYTAITVSNVIATS